MIQSNFLDIKNRILAFFQEKCDPMVKNSCLLSNLDGFILVFILLTLITSTFLESEKIAVFALAVIALTILKMFVQKGAKTRIAPWDVFLIVYFSITLISTFNSELLPQSIHGFLKTVIYIFYYFSALNYFQTNKNKIRFVFLTIGLMCLSQSIIAIYQNMCGVEQISGWQDTNYINPEDAISRAYGTLKPFNPNLLGGYLAAGIPSVIGAGMICLVKKNYKTFFSSLLVFFLCTFALFLTGSRGAYLGLGAMLLGFVFLTAKIIYTDFSAQEKIKTVWRRFVMILCGFIALILVCVPQIVKRLLSIFVLRADSSTSFRLNVYNSSLEMFKDHWILGIGTGNQVFREIYGYYMLTGYDALSSYSVPLEIAVEGGIFALLAFLGFLVIFCAAAFKFISQKDNSADLGKKITAAAAILTVIGVMTHGLFDTIYFRPQVQFLFWTIIAAASSVFYENKVLQNEKG